MTTINIRVSEADKKAVETIFAELGLNLTSATNAFYKQVIRNYGLPFELKADPLQVEFSKLGLNVEPVLQTDEDYKIIQKLRKSRKNGEKFYTLEEVEKELGFES